MTPTDDAGYAEVLRHNPRFRWLWIGTVVSLFGDWFNTIALFAMVGELTGSPLAVGLVEALKLGGYAAATIPGGILADRLDRRALMIAADVLRAILVLGFILVDDPGDVPLLYVLIVLQIGLGAVFDPAYRALLPNIVSQRELAPANTIMAATWSTILAIGASIGGLVSVELGYDAVFVITALSYVVSAACIIAIRMPARDPGPAAPTLTGARLRLSPTHLARVAYADMKDGLRYLLTHGRVLRLACAKTAWALGGAALVYFLTQLGPRLEPSDAALGIGILYSARGLGTGIGPFAARRVFRDMRGWARVSGLCVAASGVGYLVVGLVGWHPGDYALVVVLVMLAHAFSGANWVLSTILLQTLVPDHVRGRVFAAELLMLTAIEAVVILGAAGLLDGGALDLRTSFFVFAGVQIASGLAYMLWVRKDRAD